MAVATMEAKQVATMAAKVDPNFTGEFLKES
jgi:hypothetical protein